MKNQRTLINVVTFFSCIGFFILMIASLSFGLMAISEIHEANVAANLHIGISVLCMIGSFLVLCITEESSGTITDTYEKDGITYPIVTISKDTDTVKSILVDRPTPNNTKDFTSSPPTLSVYYIRFLPTYSMESKEQLKK